jgi:hypothetical protein
VITPFPLRRFIARQCGCVFSWYSPHGRQKK